MKKRFFLELRVPRTFWPTCVAGCLGVMLGLSALAGDGNKDKNLLPQNMLRSYQTECASCHIAYPPGMLARQSWRNLMKGLDSHYGADASLDAATIKELSGWLEDNAGTYKRVDLSPPEDRITQSAWFVRKHRKIQDAVWLRPSIKSAANCAACHTQAEQGDYRERNITIPKN
jgi:hypothetical protein